MGECRWTSPACLEHLTALSTRYVDLEDFFVNKLEIKNATAWDIKDELVRLSGKTDRTKSIKELLMWMNNSIGDKLWDDRIPKELGDKAIIPVKDNVRVLRSCGDDDWFIADTIKLGQLFRGLVALIDFDDDEIAKLAPLFEKLLVHRRYLSDNYRETQETVGKPILHSALTDRIRSKAEYISW